MDLIPANKAEPSGEAEVTGILGGRDRVTLEVGIVSERNIGYCQTRHV